MARKRPATPDYSHLSRQLHEILVTLSSIPTPIKNINTLDAFHPVKPLGNNKWRIDPTYPTNPILQDPHVILGRIKMLKPAFPSSPQRPPVLELKFAREGNLVASLTFAAYYPAYILLKEFIDGHDRVWVSDDAIETDEGILISTGQHELDRLLTRKYTAEELAWELPSNYKRLVAQIKGISFKQQSNDDTPDDPVPPQTKPKGDKPKPKSKPVRSGDAITIAQLAEELGILPRDARAILRKSNTPKPDAGWEWEPTQAETIRELLKKGKKR